MASALKKPRTEEEPCGDEQPRVQERPEGEGNPLIDEPRLEQESSTDVASARPPPRLRIKGREFVQLFMAKEHARWMNDVFDVSDEPRSPARTLLVNRRWLDAFFDSEPFGPARIFLPGEPSLCKLFDHGSFPLVETADGIVALLRLYRQWSEIDVQWSNANDADFPAMHKWMRVASQLRALPNLAAISLTATRLKTAQANFLVDSLPDRVTRLWTDNLRIAAMLRKRQSPLETLQITSDVGQHSYFTDVFRLKVARIGLGLWPEEEPSCHPLLHDCGPLPQNEQLRELHIDAMLFAEGDISRALRQLRAVNDHFKLVCYGAYDARLKELLNLEHVEEIVEKAKLFAAAMERAGFHSKSGELRIFFKDTENWRHVNREQVFERLNWTREGEIPWPDPQRPEVSKSPPTCSLVHERVRILIGLE